MKSFLLFILVASAILLPATGHAQTEKNMAELAKAYQDCLDAGINMPGCAKRYYLAMDSMLNIVYHRLRAGLSPGDKEALRKEQLSWLKKRDTYFRKQQTEYEADVRKGESGTDMFMVVYDRDAVFVEERVLVLLKRIR